MVNQASLLVSFRVHVNYKRLRIVSFGIYHIRNKAQAEQHLHPISLSLWRAGLSHNYKHSEGV